MRLCGIWGCNILSGSVGFFLSSSFHSCTELCKIGWSQGKPRVRRRKKSPLSPAFVFLFSSWKEHESQDLKYMAEIRDNQLICFYPKAEFTAAKFHWSVDPLLRGDYLVQEDELTNCPAPGSTPWASWWQDRKGPGSHQLLQKQSSSLSWQGRAEQPWAGHCVSSCLSFSVFNEEWWLCLLPLDSVQNATSNHISRHLL